jgi:hypothetical protein
MSEKEKEILQRLSENLPKLDKQDQHYILGVAEGMAMAKEDKPESATSIPPETSGQ